MRCLIPLPCNTRKVVLSSEKNLAGQKGSLTMGLTSLDWSYAHLCTVMKHQIWLCNIEMSHLWYWRSRSFQGEFWNLRGKFEVTEQRKRGGYLLLWGDAEILEEKGHCLGPAHLYFPQRASYPTADMIHNNKSREWCNASGYYADP